MIYLDNNATTAPSPAVVSAVSGSLCDAWANPSSKHAAAQAVKQRLSEARAQVAQLLGAQPAEVVFTSGATEANQSVLAGVVAQAQAGKLPRVVLSAIEHSGFLMAAEALAAAGRIDLRLLPVDAAGRVDMAAACEQIGPDCRLVSVMAANNETGVLQPLTEVAAAARAAGAWLHVDATQLVGNLPFDFHALGADLTSVSAHKFNGPKGIGALLVRKGLSWPALIAGSQERRRRGGTENVPGIIGFGVAAQAAHERRAAAADVAALRDQLEASLRAVLPIHVWGQQAPRLPNTSFLRIGCLDADLVLDRLERRGILAASGSACSSGGQAPSHVLLAMGVPADEARCAVRLSLSPATTIAELRQVRAALVEALSPQLATAAA